MRDPLVKTIVLNWNGGDDTLGCLQSLACQTYKQHCIIVVDNGSVDDSPDRIAEAYPQVEMIRSSRNLGFAGGNNLGIAAALQSGAEAVLLLNNDTVAAPDMVEQLVRPLFSDESIAAVNPKIYYHSEPNHIWSAGATVDRRNGITSQLHIGELDVGQCDNEYNIDYAVGCALMTRPDVIARVGLLDDDFFVYYEEAEWCLRAEDAGYRIVYIPGARIWHKVSNSLGVESPNAIYYFSRNRLLFMKKTGSTRLARLEAIVALSKMATSFFVKGDRQRSRAVWRGITDSCFGRFGEARL